MKEEVFKKNLVNLLDRNDFKSAIVLLKEYLDRDDIVYQSNYALWAEYTRKISKKIFSKEGIEAGIAFYEDLLVFFKEALEQKYGHIHKGEILWSLGSLYSHYDLELVKKNLEEAMLDNIILEKIRIDQPSEETSSYTMLCIIEKVEEENFKSKEERKIFFKKLLPVSFNAAIKMPQIWPGIPEINIKNIVPQNAIKEVLETKKELDSIYKHELKIATVFLTGAFLENILFSILFYNENVKEKQKKEIISASLGNLIKIAIRGKIIESDSIEAVFNLICIFRNRFHPGNEIKYRYKYKLTKRVAATLKILLDMALIEWAK